MTNKIITAVLLFSLSLTAFAATKIYKVVRADGSVVYTDKPPAGAIEYKLEVKPNIIPTPNKQASTGTTLSNSSQTEVSNYQVRITTPKDQATIRNNQGTVTITASISPETKGTYKLYMNGEFKAQHSSPLFVLEGLDRGEYQIKIELLDQSGKLLASSPISTFYLHKASALINAN